MCNKQFVKTSKYYKLLTFKEHKQQQNMNSSKQPKTHKICADCACVHVVVVVANVCLRERKRNHKADIIMVKNVFTAQY